MLVSTLRERMIYNQEQDFMQMEQARRRLRRLDPEQHDVVLMSAYINSEKAIQRSHQPCR